MKRIKFLHEKITGGIDLELGESQAQPARSYLGLRCDIRADPSPPITDSDTGPARDHAAGCGRARLPGLPPPKPL